MYMLQFSSNGEDRVVVGTLDVNQCIRLLDEIVGKKPQELERLLAVKEGTLPQQPASDDDISITLLVRMLDGKAITG
ncbi:plant UBX domain-containing protein 8 [Morus notabilis]|uniref:plant UBX domain-containing protein 8 n=1 Tax=Morus notabilis TaxID=981085 RepID=UPI000CED5F58|nr:plant UBX domain-containing protein 8 [Morus notabilis]